MKKTLIGVWLFLACAVAWALPTVQQVQAEVRQGHYPQAEGMMREVVDAKPGSAKAHYVYAEILAHNGSFSRAADEARKARQLDPGIKFTQPEKFEAFEKLLEREQTAVPRSQTSNSMFPAAAAEAPVRAPAGGVPSWVWLGALGLVGYLLWRGFSRSQATPSPGASYGMPATAPTNGYGTSSAGGFAGGGTPYANAPQASPASGLMRTGLAVAGGVAAGMMVDELLHRRQGTGVDQLSSLQRGIFDLPPTDAAASELENRSVDFGDGGGWDTGSAADLGGAGSDDGAWD